MAIFLLLFILQCSLAMIFKESQVLIYRNNQPTITQQKQDYLLIRSIRHYFVRSHSKETNDSMHDLEQEKTSSLTNTLKIKVNGKEILLNELLNQTWTIRVICIHHVDCIPALTLSLRGTLNGCSFER